MRLLNVALMLAVVWTVVWLGLVFDSEPDLPNTHLQRPLQTGGGRGGDESGVQDVLEEEGEAVREGEAMREGEGEGEGESMNSRGDSTVAAGAGSVRSSDEGEDEGEGETSVADLAEHAAGGERELRFEQIATFASEAASGVAAFEDATGQSYVAVANYYGRSDLFAFEPDQRRTRRVQHFLTKQAHDWEVIRLPDGSTQLLLSEYGADRSVVYQLNDSTATLPAAQVVLCADAADTASSCERWRAGGECWRNPTFMHAACPARCGLCAGLDGPLVPVQMLPTRGASAARHFAVGRRHFVGVTETGRVSVFEWSRLGGGEPWRRFGEIPIDGICELAFVRMASGVHLLALATWHSRGSHIGESQLYRVDVDNVAQPFSVVQAVPSMGAHDVEFVPLPFSQRAGRAGGSAGGSAGSAEGGLLLLVANAKNNTHQHVESHVHLLQRGGKRGGKRGGQRGGQWGEFALVQRLPTVGAHDWEAFEADGHQLFAVANQGDGFDCSSASVGIYALDTAQLLTAPLQQIGSLPTGCTTFVRAFLAAGRTFLAVAVERDGNEPLKGFRTDSVIFEVETVPSA